MMIVGGLSVTVAYVTFLVLIGSDVHYLVASIANFLVYLAINFVLNKTWAFRSHGNTATQLAAHAGLHLGNQLLIMIGLWLLVEEFGIGAAWSQAIMQIAATAAVFVLTPIIFKNK
jgi:putative flippase GtrA